MAHIRHSVRARAWDLHSRIHCETPTSPPTIRQCVPRAPQIPAVGMETTATTLPKLHAPLPRFPDFWILPEYSKCHLWQKYLIFQFSEISTSASFHSSTANLCAHSVFSRRNTHIPSDLGFWNPAPRDRGRSDSGIWHRDFGKTTKLDMVACTQTRISPREINEIDGARVPCNLLHP